MHSIISHNFSRVTIVAVALIIFLLTVDPQRVPTALLIVPFVLFFLILYFGALTLPGLDRHNRQQLLTGLPVIRPKLVAGLVAGFPTLLLVLQSIGQLTARDVLTAAAIFVITYFYIVKFSAFSNR